MEGTTLPTRLTLGRPKPRPLPQRSSHDEVSTVLALWDPTWPTSFSTNNDNNTKRKANQVPDQPSPTSTSPHHRDQTTNSSSKRQKLVSTLSLFPTGNRFRDRGHDNTTNDNKNIATKEEQMKRKKRDELVIANLNFKDSWGIKKKLTARDLRHFYMPASLMNKYILPHVDDKFTRALEKRQGAQITFHDGDTHTTHLQHVFKQSDNSYVLVWHPAFIKRRQLKEGDEIGLHWFKTNSEPVFLFSLLERGNHTAPCTSCHP